VKARVMQAFGTEQLPVGLRAVIGFRSDH